MQQFLVAEARVKEKVKDPVGLQDISYILFCSFFYCSSEIGLSVSESLLKCYENSHPGEKESAQNSIIPSTKMFSSPICIFHSNIFIPEVASYCLKFVPKNLIFLNVQ